MEETMQSPSRARPLRERLLSRAIIDWQTDCWNWTGAIAATGYGRISRGAKSQGSEYTHRVAWELWNGPIPPGLTIDHLCRNTACCNPAHLEAVSYRTNVLRSSNPAAANALKTHCKRGHEFDLLNTIHHGGGGRSCRACRRVYRNKKRGAA
jgi:hypothetical protein